MSTHACEIWGLKLNYWGMHPVARVSIKYQNTPYATNASACFIVHSLHYMFRP
jgi:hypothetical protein